MVQWSSLQASTARSSGLTPGQGTRFPHAAQPKRSYSPKKKKDQSLNYEEVISCHFLLSKMDPQKELLAKAQEALASGAQF